MDYKAIDIVVNVFTPAEFDAGQIATDDWFRAKTRQDPQYLRGMPIETYIEKMDRAGIERSLLIAVRMRPSTGPSSSCSSPTPMARTNFSSAPTGR